MNIITSTFLRPLNIFIHSLIAVFQSFAKNAGLYGERIGALHVVAPTDEAAARVKSQLSVLSRSEISNPPAHGARLVSLEFVILVPFRFYVMPKAFMLGLAGPEYKLISIKSDCY